MNAELQPQMNAELQPQMNAELQPQMNTGTAMEGATGAPDGETTVVASSADALPLPRTTNHGQRTHTTVRSRTLGVSEADTSGERARGIYKAYLFCK